MRWDRPQLVPLPATLLRARPQRAAVRAALPRPGRHCAFRGWLGPLAELRPLYDRRLFWVRTCPQITAVVSLLVAGFVLFIWWRRRSEVLYGLFGLAALLWGIRTMTFVFDERAVQWQLWRLPITARPAASSS